MKKLLVFLLVLCMSISTVNVFAAEDSYDLNADRAMCVLQALDMLNKDYDEITTAGNEAVTRADFAYLAANVFAKGRTSSKLFFHDVPREHWAFSSISLLVELNAIELDNERIFLPDEHISRSEAAEIILSILGYGVILDGDDGVVGVDSLAHSIDLYRGVISTEKLTLRDMFVIMYNGLMAETMQLSAVKSQGNVIYRGSGKTYLELHFDTYYEEGVLEGFDGTTINSTQILDGEALISGAKYDANGLDLADLIGKEIIYLYIYDENFDERTLIWVQSDDADGELVLNYFEDDVIFHKDTYTLEYYIDGSNKAKTIKLDKTIQLIYNGEFVGGGVEEILSSPFYTITLSKDGTGGKYTQAIVKAYDNYIVSGKKIDELGIYDKLSGDYISFEDSERLDIRTASGEAVEYEDIKNGDVLSVLASVSGERVEVIISDNTVSGLITSHRNENGYAIVTMNDSEYRTAKKWSDTIRMGEKITLYLDAYGYIANIAASKNQGIAAFLLNRYYDPSGVEEYLTLKLFNEGGNILKLKTADKVIIDGTACKTSKEIYDALGGEAFSIGLITYKQNTEGDINSIDTTIYNNNREGEASLREKYATSQCLYKHWGQLGSKMFIDDSTVIFGVPEDLASAEDDDFYIIKKNNLSNDTYYYASCYSLAEESDFEDLVVITGYNWNAPSSSKSGVLVTGIGTMVNNDDEVVDYLPLEELSDD